MEEGRFHFTCEFQYARHDPHQAFEVAWTFGNSEADDVPSEVVRDPVRSISLDGVNLKGHLGKYLGCKVRAYFTDHPDNTRGPWLDSNVYWAGVRPDDFVMEISEEDELRNLTLTSTIPVLCQGADDGTCCLQVRLNVNGRPDKLDTGVSCKWPLCDFLWNDATKSASLPIPVSASKDQVSDGKTDLLLTFQNLQADAGLGRYAAVFDNYQIDSVQVGVTDAETKTCTLVTDPHITGLNGQYFNLYRVGDFTIYENADRHFEVQIRTWPCWGGSVTCVCGVAVREQDDLVRIDGCDDAYYLRGQASPEVRIVTRLRLGTSVNQSTDGSMIVVYLPSGAEVSVTAKNGGTTNKYMDVTLKVPASDKGKGRGLCGTFDNDKHNEFTHRDGAVDNMCHGCEPQSFINSWKNTRSTSLFQHVPDPLHAPYIRKFCQCDTRNVRVHCSLRPDPTLTCHPCDDIGGGKCPREMNCTGEDNTTEEDDPLGFLVGNGGGRWNLTATGRRRAAPELTDVDEESASPYDPFSLQDFEPRVMSWTSPRNITETVAKATCRQTLETSQIWPHCRDKFVQDAELCITSCVEDVKIGDTFEAVLDSMVDTFTTVCQVELAKDPNNYQTSLDGKNVIKPEVSTDICSTNCLAHGRCDRGRCVCHAGFKGDNCQLPVDKAPELIRIRGSTVCDINQKPCRKVFIDAAYIQRNDTFACKVREMSPDGSVRSESVEEAEFITSLKLACHLPPARRSVTTFAITVTVDGSTFSNKLDLTVFDSICQQCSENGCPRLPNTCLISDECHADGDVNPQNAGQVCEAATSTDQWTKLYPEVAAALDVGADGNVVCRVQTADSAPTARYRVTWYIDGARVPGSGEEDIAQGSSQAERRRATLPLTGHMTCKIRSFYADRNLYSPEVESNAVNLSQSSPYPAITVTLSGPDNSNSMVCGVHTSDTTPTARYKVSWCVEGLAALECGRDLNVPEGHLQAIRSRADFASTGSLTCRMLSYYSNINVFSPHVDSNAMDLSLIPKQ